MSTDGVATRHETRRLSHSHIDGVMMARRRADAIDANLKFGNGRRVTDVLRSKKSVFQLLEVPAEFRSQLLWGERIDLLQLRLVVDWTY